MNSEINDLEQILYDDSIFENNISLDNNTNISLDNNFNDKLSCLSLKDELVVNNLKHIHDFSLITKIFYDKIFFLNKIYPDDNNIKQLYPKSILRPDNTFVLNWKKEQCLIFKNNKCSLFQNKEKIFKLDIEDFLREEQYIIIFNMIIEAIQITNNELKDLFIKYFNI